MTEHEPSRWRPRLAWLALIGGVVIYDALCPKGETLSEEAWRLRETKIGRYVVDFLVETVAGHLNQSIAPEDDWIHQLAQLRNKEQPKLTGEDRFDVFGTDD